MIRLLRPLSSLHVSLHIYIWSASSWNETNDEDYGPCYWQSMIRQPTILMTLTSTDIVTKLCRSIKHKYLSCWKKINFIFSGITLLNVDRLNLVKIAPGGHVGRFCIWTQSAINKLDSIYGTFKTPSKAKNSYRQVEVLRCVTVICEKLCHMDYAEKPYILVVNILVSGNIIMPYSGVNLISWS